MTSTESRPESDELSALTDAAPEPDPGARLLTVEAHLAAIRERLDEDTARAAARERVIDRQHEEIQRLRSAERSGVLRPVVTDLYRLRNDLLRQAATVPAAITGEQARELLRSFADEVTDALERCGVGVLPDAAGADVEPGRHQVATVVPTDDRERDGTVACVVSDGYTEIDTGRVIAPARVRVYRCDHGESDHGESDHGESDHGESTERETR
jgi:molecular chaperone GrpE